MQRKKLTCALYNQISRKLLSRTIISLDKIVSENKEFSSTNTTSPLLSLSLFIPQKHKHRRRTNITRHPRVASLNGVAKSNAIKARPKRSIASRRSQDPVRDVRVICEPYEKLKRDDPKEREETS